MNIQRVETVLGMLRPLRNRPEEHVQLSELMGEELMGAVDVLRERCAHPHTHPDDRVDLLALLGTTLVDVAWEIRGSGPASSVRKSAWPDFREILTEADEILVAALRMVPHHRRRHVPPVHRAGPGRALRRVVEPVRGGRAAHPTCTPRTGRC